MIIMRMHNIWNKIHSLHHLKSCQLEIGEAFTIIEITINMASEEIFLVINEIEGNTISKDTLNPNVFTSPTNLGFKMQDILDLIPKFGIYHIIVGKDHTDIVPTFS